MHRFQAKGSRGWKPRLLAGKDACRHSAAAHSILPAPAGCRMISPGMSRRLKILLSAYACEPHRGSEPEVGWQWALQMARFHDITVVTRERNRRSIGPELESLRGSQPLPQFVYHDAPKWLEKLKDKFRVVRPYYVMWQRDAHDIISGLVSREKFDLLHHVTFASFRYPAAIWGHGLPSVWGPVGGIESVPLGLLPWRHPPSLLREFARNADNFFQIATLNVLRRRARNSSLVIASTREMQEVFQALGASTRLAPAIGLEAREFPPREYRPRSGPLRLLFAGNLLALKGLDLAFEALKASGCDARFTLFGKGDFQPLLKRLAANLGLTDRIEFSGSVPRKELLRTYGDFDVFLFPSLHDTGGYSVIEAMANGLPVICLDVGGPGTAVQAGCGVKIPLGRRGEVIRALAEAIQRYHANRALAVEHGRQAHETVLRDYDWQHKAERMDAIYQELTNIKPPADGRREK